MFADAARTEGNGSPMYYTLQKSTCLRCVEFNLANMTSQWTTCPCRKGSQAASSRPLRCKHYALEGIPTPLVPEHTNNTANDENISNVREGNGGLPEITERTDASRVWSREAKPSTFHLERYIHSKQTTTFCNNLWSVLLQHGTHAVGVTRTTELFI